MFSQELSHSSKSAGPLFSWLLKSSKTNKQSEENGTKKFITVNLRNVKIKTQKWFSADFISVNLLACSRHSDCGDGANRCEQTKKTARGWGRGQMTFWKLTSQMFPPLSLFLLIFFPLSYFAPHSTIRTPGTGYQFVFFLMRSSIINFDDKKEFKQDFNRCGNFEPSYIPRTLTALFSDFWLAVV